MSKYLVILHDAVDNSPIGREELKLRLVDDLKVSEAVVTRLLASLPVILQRDLDHDTAQKYADNLESLGAVVEAVEQVEGITDELVRTTPNASEFGEASQASAADDLKLAPEELSDSTPTQPSVSDLEEKLDLLFDTGTEDLPTEEIPKTKATETVKVSLKFEDEPDDEPILDITPGSEPNELQEIPLAIENLHISASPPPPPPPSNTEEQGQMPNSPNITPEILTDVNIQAAFKPGGERITPALNELIKPKRTSKKAILAYLVFLGVAVSVMQVLAPKPQSAHITFDVDTLLKQQHDILSKDDSTEEQLKKITGQWAGETNENGVVSRGRALEINSEMSFVRLEVITPKPPPLSKNEFAAGLPPPIWLRKFESNNLRRAQSDSDILFRGQGRAFLEQNELSDRVLVDVELVIKKDTPNPQDLTIHWTLRKNKTEPGEALLRRTPNKDIELFIQGNTVATPQVAEEPKAKTHQQN